MDGKQTETLEWLNEMERYVKEKQLSMRILDSIDECRKNVVSKNADWNRICLQAEELLESIGKKVLPAVAQVEESGNEVSVAMVEDELKNMARRCHAENETSIYNFENRKNIILQNLFIKLQDITRVKAHLEEMKNENSYQVFFQRVKAEYHNNVLTMVRELLQDARNNHEQMMERMKSMLRSIKAYRHGLSSEKIYQECDTRIAGLDNRVRNEIESLETGEEISSFGRRTGKAIKPIVKKLERKRIMLAWLPVIVVLCLVLAGVAGTYVMMTNASRETGGDVTMEDVKEIVGSAWQVYERFKSVVEAVGNSGVVIYAIFILLAVALVYALYLWLLKRWCNRKICDKCGAYLKAELEDFEKNCSMLSRMDDMIHAAVEMYERQYVMILNELLTGSDFDPESEEKKEADRFSELKNNWNAIKYR